MTRVDKAEKHVERLFQDYQSRWRDYAKCADKAGGADHVEVCACTCMNNQRTTSPSFMQ